MLSMERKLQIIGVYFVLLFSLIGCPGISTLGTDRHNGVSSIKRVISSDDLRNDEVESSHDLKEGCNDLHVENVERNVRLESHHVFIENRTISTNDEKKSFSTNRKGKNQKKLSRSEKKIEGRMIEKVTREKSNSLLSDNLQKRNVRSVNTTNYYAQRKAVMDKYYLRRKEIAAKYGKERNNFNITANSSKDTSTVRVAPDKDNRTLEVNNEVDNPISKTLNSHDRKPTVGNITDYSPPTTRNCTNASLSGTLPRKSRNKLLTLSSNENTAGENVESHDRNEISVSPRPNRQDVDNTNVDQRWGTCDGSLVYQHNLLLGLKGPSNLETIFEVVMQGPICITCVEVLRYNRTRAIVSLDSGGRGYEFVKLRLKGYENEGFSYIVKVWGVKKRSDNCARQL